MRKTIGESGQASILVAFIFQIVFLFFAMVINVGLLVHDKINLQNSVDIGAYYAAMKQAEILNAIAHTNYQIHQAWKLLAYRVWIVGEAGRNISMVSNRELETSDAAEFHGNTASPRVPVVCVRNPAWLEAVSDATTNVENICKQTGAQLPTFTPLNLTPIEKTPFTPFTAAFRDADKVNMTTYHNDCKSGASAAQKLGTNFIMSFKDTVNPRLHAIQQLERQLIADSPSFRDLDNQPVYLAVDELVKRNLTKKLREGPLEVIFENGVANQPFLRPLEVRTNISYLDMKGTASSCRLVVKRIIDRPEDPPADDLGIGESVGLAQLFLKSDWGSSFPLDTNSFLNANFQISADAGAATAEDKFRTIIGVEKDPWKLLWVRVYAQAQSKNLFAPTGYILLKAEGYAMPFGGKIGPRAYQNWNRSAEQSSGAPIDPTLPPFKESQTALPPTADNLYRMAPNYAHFPGDRLGMRSGAARRPYAKTLPVGRPKDTSPELFRLGKVLPGDYDKNIRDKQDGLSFRDDRSSDLARDMESAAIAPDLFDVAYYSIDLDFSESVYPRFEVFGGVGGDYGRKDFGYKNAGGLKNYGVATQIERVSRIKEAFWKVSSPAHVNSSWVQESSDSYKSASKAGEDKYCEKCGDVRAFGGGGRSGFSVKLVSPGWLKSSQLELAGQESGRGGIKNPPKKQFVP